MTFTDPQHFPLKESFTRAVQSDAFPKTLSSDTGYIAYIAEELSRRDEINAQLAQDEKPPLEESNPFHAGGRPFEEERRSDWARQLILSRPADSAEMCFALMEMSKQSSGAGMK